MTKSFKFFLTALILSLPFWWLLNGFQADLEEVFYWQEFANNPKILTAQANQLAFEERVRSLKPLRDNRVEDLTINSKSAVSLLVNYDGEERILFEKEIDQKLPVASLTKLMTAYVVLQNYDLAKEIKISQEAVGQEENLGKLTVGEILSVEQLLYPLLMESSNDAAFSLAHDYDGMTGRVFVELMNLEARKLGLKNTSFSNATGLDGDSFTETNYSSASDLTLLAKTLLKSPLIRQILATPQINLYGQELINSNKLLGEIPEIIGGKTGYTEEALGCFLLVLEAPKGKGYLVHVILGTPNNRFAEMEKLIDWVKEAYNW